MTRFGALVAAGLLGLCWAWLGALPASASCAEGTDAERIARADVIFTGLLLRDEAAQFGRQRALTFRVSEVYKGTAFTEQVVMTPGRGSEAGLRLTPPGPFLVFAARDATSSAPADQLISDECSGTRPGTTAPGLATGRPPAPGSSRPRTPVRSAAFVAVGTLLIAGMVYFGRRGRRAPL